MLYAALVVSVVAVLAASVAFLVVSAAEVVLDVVVVVAVNPAGGFIEIATIIIVEVSTDIKVSTVITQLHI